jgi:hypothetical protein
VHHEHETDHCEGWLTISRGQAAFAATDGVHSFSASPVETAGKNNAVGGFFTAKSGHSFHICLRNNKQTYNFSPTSKAASEETEFIIGSLQ